MSPSDTTANPSPQPLDSWFLDLLACPACEQHLPVHLSETKDTLRCACGRYAYPIRDGIPILLVDEATLLDENAHPEDVAG
jgi:uncharacterized protein YbaR (Trm112 family)